MKIRSKGIRKRSRDILLKFRDPLHISGTVEAKNFKFGMQIDHEALIKICKLGQRALERIRVTYCMNFGTPYISQKRLGETIKFKFGTPMQNANRPTRDDQ